MIDKNDGRVLLLKEGKKGYIDTSPEEEAYMAGNVVTHNHTYDCFFSSGDLCVYLRARPREFRAVLPDGTVYRLRNNGITDKEADKAAALFTKLVWEYEGYDAVSYRDNGVLYDIIKIMKWDFKTEKP